MSAMYELNMQMLRAIDAELAAQVASTPPAEVTWHESRQPPALGATIETTAQGRRTRVTLAGKYRPIDDAKQIADGVDLGEHATVVMLGLGAGHHVAELAQRLDAKGLLIVYEPDLALVRAVMERVDCRPWLSRNHVALFAGDVPTPKLTQRLESATAFITQGSAFVTHGPTRQLHGEAIKEFADRFTEFVAYCRTSMATTLANASTTCRNLAGNAGQYAAGSPVNDLRGCLRGYPAVLVSAGPSLAKNVHLLAEPGVRDRVAIIAVQTVLKPLLDRGVKPHFVTALDYHEISKRFYENLPTLDDVTLVAEPKANSAILDHYPGPVRLIYNQFLARLLGSQAPYIDELQSGTTVAHLSLYLAQYLGCDPIILIGQDLGFSDGLYYCPGTAIHNVWATELSSWNTLEMMEWRRIVRHKSHLSRRTDINGRRIYSDEQMQTYLKQFERDFAAAAQTIVDATEGGQAKQNTQCMTLSDALGRYAQRDLPAIPEARRELDSERLTGTSEQLHQRLDEVRELRRLSVRTMDLLRLMKRHQRDPKRMQRLFNELAPLQKRVAELDDTFELVNSINQIGAFNRLRADRAISIDGELDEYERQMRQLDRDLENLRWLADACEEAVLIFDDASARVKKLAAGSSVKGEPENNPSQITEAA